MSTPLEVIEIATGATPTASVIWLHGFGADGNDFVPIVPELDLPTGLAIRFLFPHAPERPITMYGGQRMRAWSDVLGMQSRDEAGIRASQRLLEEMIADEKERGIPTARIVLAGFSQGGAIALQTALRHPERLAGVMALSTMLPLAETVAAERHAANAAVPILMAHGTHDGVIAIERAQTSREALNALGYAIEWHDYPMEHSVCAEEIADISEWLQRVLA